MPVTELKLAVPHCSKRAKLVQKRNLGKDQDENTLAVNKAYETFHTIYTDINSTSEIVTSMIEEIEQVNDVASNMAAISEEQSASAEEISATIEVLAANAQTVTQESTQVEECAEVVAESAKTLTGHMQKFKL